MSASPPIAAKHSGRSETSLRATSRLMHCSKMHRYSITSSARPSSVIGNVRPSAFAVLRLRCSSNFVACYWQVSGFLTHENSGGIDASQAVVLRDVRSVAHQTPGRREIVILVDRGHRMANRQRACHFLP